MGFPFAATRLTKSGFRSHLQEVRFKVNVCDHNYRWMHVCSEFHDKQRETEWGWVVHISLRNPALRTSWIRRKKKEKKKICGQYVWDSQWDHGSCFIRITQMGYWGDFSPVGGAETQNLNDFIIGYAPTPPPNTTFNLGWGICLQKQIDLVTEKLAKLHWLYSISLSSNSFF